MNPWLWFGLVVFIKVLQKEGIMNPWQLNLDYEYAGNSLMSHIV